MKQITKSLFLLFGFCFLSISAFAGTIDVSCDGTGDRQAIQDAIDTANEHDIVHIHGTCIFDGERVVINKSHLTLRGDAEDTNGDGSMDVWHTVLKGNGNVDDLLTGPYTNLGLYVGNVPATDEDIIGVTIEQLKLQDFYLALTVGPGVLNEDNLICEELQVTDARAVQTRIQQNNFVDNSNHFFLYGAANNTLYDRNLTEGGGGIPLAAATFVLSKKSVCLVDPDTGEQSSVSIGTSNNYKVTNSRFVGVGVDLITSDVELVNARNSSIKGNHFEGDAQPIFLFGAINTKIQNNVLLDSVDDAVDFLNSQNTLMSKNIIQGAGANGVLTLELPPAVPVVGLLGLPGSKNNRIHCNHIEDAAGNGLIIIDSKNHIAQNRFVNNPLDLLLLEPGNKVIVNPEPIDSVVDASGGNKVIRKGNKNDCAPEVE